MGDDEVGRLRRAVGRSFVAAQDDTVLGICRGGRKRRFDFKFCHYLLCFSSNRLFFPPSLNTQIPVILSDSEGSLASGRNFQNIRP